MMTEEQRLINETLKTSRDYLIEQAEFTAERLKEYDKCSERMFALMALEYMRLAAITQPASRELKLPDGWVAVPLEPSREMRLASKRYNSKTKLPTGPGVYKAMVAAAPAAPHTAPIEPICATGGAEWVKVPREPTRQMMSQGHFAMAGTDRGKFRRIYQAMIAAAPQPE